MSEVRVKAGCPFKLVDVFMDDVLTEGIEIEIVLVITERLFNLFPGSEETKIDERRDAHACNSRPSELIDELERKEE